MRERPHIYWTPCAAHSLDLILEYIGKMKTIGSTTQKARSVTTFMYKHTLLLDLMRKKLGGRDLVRAGVTRFATCYLTLYSLNKHKNGLRALFVSEEWRNSNWAKKSEGRKVENLILSVSFWRGVLKAILAFQPFVMVLRRVEREDERPMGYIYNAMMEAREKLKENFKHNDKEYGPILAIVDDRWKDHMSHPLHIAGYFLNPSIYYTEREKDPESVLRFKMGFMECLEKMIPDPDIQDEISDQLVHYVNGTSSFGKPLAVRQRTTKSARKESSFYMYFLLSIINICLFEYFLYSEI